MDNKKNTNETVKDEKVISAYDLLNKVIEEESSKNDEEFQFISVMEHLVALKIVDQLKSFGNCTCSRCIADATALALTNLPPKYVVTAKGTVSPLLSYYDKKYDGQVTVEITKACIRVASFPHHSHT